RTSADDAQRAARGWMRGMSRQLLLSLRARLEAPKLCHVPFLRVDATVLGWRFGIRRSTGMDGKTTVSEEELEVCEEHRELVPLTEVGERGLHRLRLAPGAKLAAWDAEQARGEVLPVLTAEDAALGAARDRYLAAARKANALDEVKGEELTCLVAGAEV